MLSNIPKFSKLIIWLAFCLWVLPSWAQHSGSPARSGGASKPVPAARQGGEAQVSQQPGGVVPALVGAGPLTQALGQQGIRKCLARSEQLSRFWGFSATDGAMFLPAPGGPDERTLAISLELHKQDLLTYVGLSLTPEANTAGCGASYEAITYWPATCAVVARQVFGNFPFVGAIQREISVLDAGQASKVFLMPAGAGCVSIKREVLLQ